MGIKEIARGRAGWRDMTAQQRRERALHVPVPALTGRALHFAQMDRITNASRDAARAASQAKARRRETELFERRKRAAQKAAAA